MLNFQGVPASKLASAVQFSSPPGCSLRKSEKMNIIIWWFVEIGMVPGDSFHSLSLSLSPYLHIIYLDMYIYIAVVAVTVWIWFSTYHEGLGSVLRSHDCLKTQSPQLQRKRFSRRRPSPGKDSCKVKDSWNETLINSWKMYSFWTAANVIYEPPLQKGYSYKLARASSPLLAYHI